jgi:hypothetical protein
MHKMNTRNRELSLLIRGKHLSLNNMKRNLDRKLKNSSLIILNVIWNSKEIVINLSAEIFVTLNLISFNRKIPYLVNLIIKIHRINQKLIQFYF